MPHDKTTPARQKTQKSVTSMTAHTTRCHPYVRRKFCPESKCCSSTYLAHKSEKRRHKPHETSPTKWSKGPKEVFFRCCPTRRLPRRGPKEVLFRCCPTRRLLRRGPKDQRRYSFGVADALFTKTHRGSGRWSTGGRSTKNFRPQHHHVRHKPAPKRARQESKHEKQGRACPEGTSGTTLQRRTLGKHSNRRRSFQPRHTRLQPQRPSPTKPQTSRDVYRWLRLHSTEGRPSLEVSWMLFHATPSSVARFQRSPTRFHLVAILAGYSSLFLTRKQPHHSKKKFRSFSTQKSLKKTLLLLSTVLGSCVDRSSATPQGLHIQPRNLDVLGKK